MEEYTKLGPNFSHRIQQSEYSPEWQEDPNQDTQHNARNLSASGASGSSLFRSSKINEELDSIAPNTHEKNENGVFSKDGGLARKIETPSKLLT